MRFEDKEELSANTSFLSRARQVTDGDQTTSGDDTKWKQCFQSFSLSMAQMVFRRFLCSTMLKNEWKTYLNHRRFDVLNLLLPYSRTT